MGLIKSLAIKGVLFLAIAGIAAGALFYYGQGLKDAKLEEFKIEELTDISPSSFTLSGYFDISNPSELSVPVKSLEYEIFLKETDELLSEGSIPSFNLKKQEITRIPFEHETRWVPAAQLAAQLVTQDEVFVIIKGKIRIDIPKLSQYELPFEKEVDIKPYIEQFASNPVNPILPSDEENPEEDNGLLPLKLK